jgi:hypothetical protein
MNHQPDELSHIEPLDLRGEVERFRPEPKGDEKSARCEIRGEFQRALFIFAVSLGQIFAVSLGQIDPGQVAVFAGGFEKGFVHGDGLFEVAAGALGLPQRPQVAGQIVVENGHFE